MENRRSFIKKSGLLLAGAIPLVAIAKSSGLEPQSRVITLNVDTGSIERSNMDQSCNFGQEDGITNEQYTIEAVIGDTITWKGVSTSSETDVVNITSINYQGGKNVFGQNVLAGNRSNPETVSGKVLYATPEGQHYKYVIKFTVYNNGSKRNGTFQIDPVIQVHG